MNNFRAKFCTCLLALAAIFLFQNCSRGYEINDSSELNFLGPTPTPSVTPTPALTPTPSPSPTPGSSPLSSARIFLSGHSLLWEPIGENLVTIANSLGTSARYNEQLISGSTIGQRSRGSSPSGSTLYAGYSQGFNRDYTSNMNVVNEFLNPQTLGGDRYDTLIITERHDLLISLDYQDTVKYLRHYYDRFMAGSPMGKVYFYESWLSHVRTKMPEWIAYERKASVAWHCIAVRVNHSLAAEGKSQRISSLAAGAALAEMVERALAGNVAGVSGATATQTLDRIFTDDVHITPVAAYYMSLVTYAYVYRRSPVGSAYPSTVTATQAAALQTIAWQFVSNYNSTFTTRTLAQCRTEMVNFCSDFWNFDWTYANNPSRIPGCQANYSANMSYNPMHYDPATDASYWLPAPSP